MIKPSSLQTIVMIPTYNEAGNIEKLIKAILKLNNKIGILIVDDNSADGTAEIVKKLDKKYQNKIHLIVRKGKRGRATAGIAGHKKAIYLKSDYIVEMDADFSHDPKYIKTFLQDIKSCDVVLGSRFVKGGKDADRDPLRTNISIISGIIFRAILGVKIKDIGSGFKLYKRKVLQSLPWDNFQSYGIAISMEECFRIVKKGWKIKEVPIIFIDRQVGYSKLRWKDFFEPVKVCLQLVFELGRV
jgi:dolichol-phosphate mannosyltransferase